MLKRLNNPQLNIIIGLILIYTTFVGYLYVNSASIASTLWPTAGFVVGLYYTQGKRVLPGLVSGIFIANLIARIFLLDEAILLTITLSLVFTFSNLIQALIFTEIVPKVSAETILSVKKLFIYLGVALITAIVGAIIAISFLYILNDYDDFLLTISRWIFGDFSGIVIFGTEIIFAYLYDSKSIKSKANFFWSIIFVISFTLFAFLVFSSILPFYEFAILFVLFFFLVSFYFSYRMIITINLIYIVTYHLFIYSSPIQSNYTNVVFSLNLYLFIFSSIALLSKTITYNLELKNTELVKSKTKIDTLLDSTKTLFKLSDALINTTTKINDEYLIQMFKIGTTILEKFEYASLYIKTEDSVEYIASYGYDIDILNTYFDDLESFEWELNDPRIVNYPDEEMQSQLQEKYAEFASIYPKIKQSIRFNIYVEEGVVGGMSFDIMKDSEHSFTSYDIDNFRSYQKLMNSFYEVNHLNQKTSSLKNDIVLSLIRTLELYDHYTGGHSEEVAFLAGEIAKKMQLSKQEIYNAYWAGIVHDIGKVGIPSNIINKPEKLSLEEFAQIQDHPVFGYQILKKSEDLKAIALYVKHHHEWWNGEGYPDHLKGDEIPLIAQILVVCDAVSSMATKRPYTAVKSSKEILKELELYTEVQFAPRPAKAMIEFIKEGSLDKFYQQKHD